MIIDSVDLLRMACMNRDGSTPPRECPPLIVPSVGELLEAADELERLRAEVEALRSAVLWALGYDQGEPEFTSRPEGAGAYWWRTELRRRAGITQEHTNGR